MHSSSPPAVSGWWMNSTAVALSARIQLVAYCGVLPVICLLGILGNTTNLVTLASRRLRAVSYMYLRALAIADLLCMVFVLGFVSGQISTHLGLAPQTSHLRAFYQAHLMLSLINWTLSTGVLIVLALTLERFISIVFPIHFRSWNSPKRATRAILLAYTIPALFYLPYGIFRYAVLAVVHEDGSVTYKAGDSVVSKTPQWQIYEWTREGMFRFAPILLLCVLNAKIMLAFRRRQQMVVKLMNRVADAATTSRDDSLLYLLGGIAVMFFICNIPAAINLLLINDAIAHSAKYQIFRAIANLLEISNHASQFYVFCACSTDYRATFLEKFPCFREEFDTRRHLRSIVRRAPPSSTTAIGGSKAGDSHVGRDLLKQGVVDVHLASADEGIEECYSLLPDDERPPMTDVNGITYL